MGKKTKQISRMGKIFLVLMVSFSQLSFPLEVLADEFIQDDVLEESNETADEPELTLSNQEVVLDETENSGFTNDEATSDEILEENTTMEDETKKDEENVPTEDESKKDEENSPKEDQPEESAVIVSINGQLGREYEVTGEQKIVDVHFVTPIEERSVSFDYTNQLYGTYEYDFQFLKEDGTEENVTITIHYSGDNSEILNQYTTLTYKEGSYIVLGTANANLTKEEFLSNFNHDDLLAKYNATLELVCPVSDDETSLDEESPITSRCELHLSNERIEDIYRIQVVGDYNLDGIVNELDSWGMLDGIVNQENANAISDVNQDGYFNILDATHPIFTEGLWDNQAEALDELSNSLVSKGEVNKGEELTVKYYINGFEKDILKGIEGQINYNKELLELVNVDIQSVHGFTNEEGKFAFLLDNYHSNGILMTITFKAIQAGDANISIDNIIASTGVLANLDDSISTTVTVVDYGKGGDEEPTEKPPVIPTPAEETTPTVVPVPTVTAVTQTVNTPRRVVLSSDSLIQSLTIEGYQIDFDKNTYEYSIKVKNSVKSLDLNVVLNNASASYSVEGNSNFKVGENTVNIVVTAEDGSSSTYTIKVTKEKATTNDKEEDEEKEESKSSKTIIIILIVLVIIGLIYVIFKDDEEDKKDSKK